MGVTLGATVAKAATAMGRVDGGWMAVRVRLAGVDRLACAVTVDEAVTLEARTQLHDPSVQRWMTYPTGGGTLLHISNPLTALGVLEGVARRLTAEGFEGSIDDHRGYTAELSGLEVVGPAPALAVLALTVDPPYDEGPFHPSGAVRSRWGVPATVTRALAEEWADWVVPITGEAMLTWPDVDIERDDAADVLLIALSELEHVPSVRLVGRRSGSPGERLVSADAFGEVVIGETESTSPRISQALSLLRDRVLPHAADLDYATVRVSMPGSHRRTASGEAGTLWHQRLRHLWSQYVADPNGIQVLTESHIDKARDLTTNWNVTEICRGRWLVQAKDLTPWFETIDETAALWLRPYVNPEVMAEARYDFGNMLLTPEIAADMKARPRQDPGQRSLA